MNLYDNVAHAVSEAFYALFLVMGLLINPMGNPVQHEAHPQVEQQWGRTEATVPNGVYCPNRMVCRH